MKNNYKIDPREYLENNRINANLNKERKNFLYQQEIENDKKILDNLSKKYDEEDKIKLDKKKQIQNEQLEHYNNYMKNKYEINKNKNDELLITIGKEKDYISKINEQDKLNCNKSKNHIINNSFSNYINQNKINQINYTHGYNIINLEPDYNNIDLYNKQNYTINSINSNENNINNINLCNLQINNQINENKNFDKYNNDKDYNDNKLQNNKNINNINNNSNEEKLSESEYRTYNEYLNKLKNEVKNNHYTKSYDNIRNINNYYHNLNQISNSQFQNNNFQNNNQNNINDRFYNDENYNNYIYHNKNQYQDNLVPLQNQMNRLTLEARNQYLLNKKKNSLSYNNIYTKQSKLPKDTFLNYNPFTISRFNEKKKIEQIKEYLDSQIDSKNIYKDTYFNLEQKFNTNFKKKEYIKNNNIYDEINKKNIELKDINISPYSYWKNYSIGHFFEDNNLNINNNNNKNNNNRIINERLQNLGNNIINQ